jgi:hypothetical protein
MTAERRFRVVRWVVVVLILGTLLAACGPTAGERPIPGGPVDTGAGTLTAARTFLEGRWVLESFEVYPSGSPPVTLKGAGTLVYDDFGNLTMEIKADEASSDVLRRAGIDVRDGVISTTGRTAVDMQNRTLTYVLKGQEPLMRGPLGMHRARHWIVEGDTLILTTRDESGKPLSVGRWRRVS